MSVGELGGWFITTFVPIALAYDVAHNLSFLALGAQYLIPILSDPLGIGWDLFGTKLYLIDTGVVTTSLMWYVAIAVIVGGDVVAVYLAHTQALRLFPRRAEALRSQIPLVVLMIAYTMRACGFARNRSPTFDPKRSQRSLAMLLRNVGSWHFCEERVRSTKCDLGRFPDVQ